MMDQINVEKIMESIREEIKTSGADKIPLSFDDSKNHLPASEDPSDRLSSAIKYLSYNYEVQPYQMLTGNPVKVFIKKVFRKIGSFFFIPIVGQQNILNYHFFLVSEAVADQKNEIEELKGILDDLNGKIDKLEGRS